MLKTNKYSEKVILIEKYLRHVDYIVRKKGREILNDFSITWPQFIALQILIDDGNLTVGELSQRMSLACSTITDLIDRMEKNNLVERIGDEKDKRIVRIKVKSIGYELVDQVLEKRRIYLSSKLKDLDEEKKDFLLQSLFSLYEAMKEEDAEEE